MGIAPMALTLVGTSTKYREHRHERFLSAQELARLGERLAKPSSRDVSPFIIGAIRLLALTGARLSEILTLRWENVDFENASLRLPELEDWTEVDLPQCASPSRS